MATGRVLGSCPGCLAAVRRSRLGPQLFVSAAMHELREEKTKLLTTPSPLLRMCGGGGASRHSGGVHTEPTRDKPTADALMSPCPRKWPLTSTRSQNRIDSAS